MKAFSRKNLAVPYALFMALFIVIPLFLVVYYAFTDDNGVFTLLNITKFFSSGSSMSALVYSIYIALLTTGFCLIIGFPVAYIMSNDKYNKSKTMIVLFILPMWMNFLLRTLAIREMFFYFDIRLGELSTIIGMIYNFLPFMILPIYTALLKIDKSLLEASADLGATSTQTLVKIIMPLSTPGIFSGVLMVFMPTISTFVISDLLSVGRIQLLGNLINLQFSTVNNWNVGSAISLVLLVLIGATVLLSNKADDTSTSGGGLW